MKRPDVIVVGAGAGGPVVAKELAERQVKVLVLEAGPWLDPDVDFTRLEDDMGSIVDGRLRWGPTDRSRSPWMRRRDGVGLILQAAGVGGTTLHYNGISPRAYPSAIDADWPMSYEELIPYYERVEAFLPVRQVEEGDLATKDALFGMGCEKIGLSHSESKDVTTSVWRRCHNAILPVAKMSSGRPLRYPDVDGCTMSGHCLVGCRNPVGAPLERKAKRATNVTYVPAAVATGECEIVPNAFATALIHEPSGEGKARVRGVRWRDTESGETHEAEAAVVVLAGGSIESPRLYLNSDLPNEADAVGRYLTTHAQDLVTGFFDREVHPDVGQVSMARADFPGFGTLFTQGYGPQSFSVVLAGGGGGFWDEDPGDEPWDFAGRWWGPEAVTWIEQYHRSLSILVCTDDEEHPDNRVTLAGDWPVDEHGPVPRVAYRPTPRSKDRQDWLARKGAEILRAAGARRIHRANFPRALLTHLMGTMRMGRDPGGSVVGPTGEAHLVDGLYVGDSSILPNGLGGPNPTLTVQALATRTADQILAHLS
ncbi:MAG TPA: GMC family oxidoreductase [Actinomycetota bacterium]